MRYFPFCREVAPHREAWEIAVFRNAFGIILSIPGFDAEQKSFDNDSFTFEGIQRWIEDHYGVKVSKSSISMVKKKCNESVIGFKAGKEPKAGVIKTEREKLVLEAFRALGVV